MRLTEWSSSKVGRLLIANFPAEAIYVRDDGIAAWPLRLTTGWAYLIGGRNAAASLEFQTPIGFAMVSSDAEDA